MKPLTRHISMTTLFGFGVCAFVLATPAAVLAAQPCPGPSEAAPPDLLAQAHQVRAYPTFCAIPPKPVGVRGAAAFKTAVVDTRVAGARLVGQTAASTLSLDDTDQFAAAARGEAAPPLPMTTPDQSGAEDFVNSGRKRVTPPARPH
jgi:hypothetical protein